MNIAELRQAPPGTSQYLDAQLLVIGLAKIVNTPRGQRCVQECQVIDQQGSKETIAYWFDADKPDFAMPAQQINQWMRWKVKTKPKGQYLNISGYPEKATEQPQYSPPPQGHAARPNAETQQMIDQRLRPNQPAQQPKQPDWDEIARGKVRCNLVCAVLQSGVNPDIATLDSYMGYIFNGLQRGNPNDEPTEDGY